jgi:hypothetical protein
MKIDRIKYGKSFQIHDGLWEKIGVEIEMTDTDDAEKARILAKEVVEDIFKKNNPSLSLSAVQYQSQLPVISNDNINENDHVYLATKIAIELAPNQEEAEEILNAAGFRFNVELKNLVNSKPPKQ